VSGHTPTPWRIEEGTTGIWGACNPDDQSSYGMGYPVTDARITPVSMSSWCKGPYADEGEANARRIVAAVNGTSTLTVEALEAGVVDKLVEALADARTTIVITRTNIMTEISRYSDSSESRWAGVPEQLAKRIGIIDAALALARGEQA